MRRDRNPAICLPKKTRSGYALALVALACTCGGRSTSPGDVAGKGGTLGGSASGATGGAAGAKIGQGGFGAVIQAGGRGGESGAESGAAGETAGECDVYTLFIVINTRGPLGGSCWEASPMLGPGEQLSRRRGAVVIDDDGRVIDNTGLMGEVKQRWLDDLADERWPCLAGRTIGYECAEGSG
jgi:hypothetical protein